MIKLNRLLTNICSNNLPASQNFYTKLFDFRVGFESDWFIHLVSGDGSLELGIIDRKHETVPKDYQRSPQGIYLTFVVDDAGEVHELAKRENFEIVSEPADTFYGQRRLLLKDPDGTLVDVSSPIEGFEY